MKNQTISRSAKQIISIVQYQEEDGQINILIKHVIFSGIENKIIFYLEAPKRAEKT